MTWMWLPHGTERLLPEQIRYAGRVKYFLHTPDYRHAAVVLAEWNQANPYTYAHKEPVQNYAHLNQPLAHPLGANFREFIIYGSYRLAYRYYASGRFQVAMTGLDSSAASNVGRISFLSDFTIRVSRILIMAIL